MQNGTKADASAPESWRSHDHVGNRAPPAALLRPRVHVNGALRLGKIQFHADAVGIVEKELRIAGARHDALAEFDILRQQALAHTVDVGRGKGDLVEPASV